MKPYKNSGEERFNAWLTEVDEYLFDEVGLGHDDLPDRNWYDIWEDGDSAECAGANCIKTLFSLIHMINRT